MTKLTGPLLKGLGTFDGKTHVLPISVYYEDTDLSGVVYHANYLRYMERGRTEFFRLAGIALTNLVAGEPSAWTIRHAAVTFHAPARLDDQLEVRSVLTSVTGARINARQSVHAGSTLLSDGRIEACIITLTGKLQRIPQEIRDLLTPYLYETET